METVQASSLKPGPEDRLPAPTAAAAADPWHPAGEIGTLERIQDRLLWLSMNIIHHANHGRPNPEKSKVGGHPASCASALTLLTALYFSVMREGDRIAVKPHASPVMHAAMYLLGVLPRERLATLRQYGGLQAYPSRTKDPDAVDFSTGSVGLGAVAPTFAALVERYAHAHFQDTTARRFIAVSGDAELDEGNVWEAIIDESLQGLGSSLWVIDLNRQSLDRVVPGVRAARLKALFADSGWQVIEAKYGARLLEAFRREGGAALRECIDDMLNEEYQSLIRRDGREIRAALLRRPRAGEISRSIEGVSDEELPSLLANLGGHDLPVLLRAFDRAGADTKRPTVVFAYTIKGWRLPIAGDPFNHSALLSPARLEDLRGRLGVDPSDPWPGFAPGSAEDACCRRAAARLGLDRHPGRRPPLRAPAVTVEAVPRDLPPVDGPAVTSTQEAFGRVLLRLGDLPGVGERLVTTSPDVSVSTGLAGWINKAGLFSLRSVTDYEAGTARVLEWNASGRGRHIELGISEMNLFSLLGQLGLSHEMNGQVLFPIGTVYDPFVCRGLDALIFGLYSGSRFLYAGTPSGVSLSSEGGAHQSSVTAALGMELPALDYYEPCFAVETEWALLEGLRQCCDRPGGRCSYLRLSTKPVDQRLVEPALARLGREALREQALAGGYLLREAGERGDGPRSGAPLVHLVSCGAMIPETLAAAEFLEREGVAARVIHLVSPRRALEDWRKNGDGGEHVLASLLPPHTRRAPIVTVIDGAASALSWVGGVFGQPTTPLGVRGFGQSGSRRDLYHCMGIDEESILEAAFAAVDAAYPEA
jgi:pyruvate dehydrogenase E1 component